MSKSQHGNKEAKKPKKVKTPTDPALPATGLPMAAAAVAVSARKRGGK
jgi:hypothetical protein